MSRWPAELAQLGSLQETPYRSRPSLSCERANASTPDGLLALPSTSATTCTTARPSNWTSRLTLSNRVETVESTDHRGHGASRLQPQVSARNNEAAWTQERTW